MHVAAACPQLAVTVTQAHAADNVPCLIAAASHAVEQVRLMVVGPGQQSLHIVEQMAGAWRVA